jgi:exodeoxyribonuclease VII small subunit
MSAKPKSTAAEPTFETAMDRLEAIVEQMESGKLPLEELIVRYEEGMNMVKVCQERLTAAEQKIEIIARDSAGQAVVKPFEPDSAPNAPEPERHKNDNNDDDVSLF